MKEARATFPATLGLTYLDAAAVSIISTPVYEAEERLLGSIRELR